jgi:Trk K+ transport system NAD-binding subunit
MVGGAMWGLLHEHVLWMPPQSAPFVIVGMMALFGGIAKAPIAVIIMVAEMTNEYSMVVPAMAATTVAYLVASNTGIYENQVRSRAASPAHQHENALSMDVELHKDDHPVGRTIAELDLPADALITAVFRKGELLIPRGRLVLQAGDRLQVLSTSSSASQLVARIRSGPAV